MPAALEMQSWLQIEDVLVHYCGFGAPWLKPTTFRCFLIPGASHWFGRVCSGGIICEFTKRPHVLLRGRNTRSVWYTELAEPYPYALCTQLAKAMINAGDILRFALRANVIRNACGARQFGNSDIVVPSSPHMELLLRYGSRLGVKRTAASDANQVAFCNNRGCGVSGLSWGRAPWSQQGGVALARSRVGSGGEVRAFVPWPFRRLGERGH
jgi:hypothetical protein